MDTAVPSFVQHQRELLRLERAAELEEVSALQESLGIRNLVRAGLGVAKLKFGNVRAGLRGRWVVELLAGGGRQLSWGQLRPGDPVVILSDGFDGVEGVIKKAGSAGAEVVVNAWDAMSEERRYSLVKSVSDVTLRRCVHALESLQKVAEDSTHAVYSVVNALFGRTEPRFIKDMRLSPRQEACLAHLNQSQREAVQHALAAKDLAVLHGPPGSGKTTAVISLIRAAVEGGAKVLFVAPSNIAVDHAAEKLVGTGLKFARLGHPARVSSSVEPYLLESMLEATDDWGIVRDIRGEMEALRRGKQKTDWTEFKRLRKESRKREEVAMKRLLANLNVVLSTTVGAGARVLGELNMKQPFDIVVIDEAAQATESESLIALLSGRKVVLAGDPCQLPPTVLSSKAEEAGLRRSLLDHIFDDDTLREQCVKMLTIQYRMNEIISNWSSCAMYQSQLVAASEVASQTLTGIKGCNLHTADEDGEAVFIFVDTAGCGCEEDYIDDSATPANRTHRFVESKSNRGEATVIVEHVRRLFSIGIKPCHIAVISPYSKQVSLLQDLLQDEFLGGLEIATVDSFQGREKEAVLISLVRSNDIGEVGFLKDNRRLNVAITRARRHCLVVGDSETVSRHPFLADLIKYIEEHGDYRTAVEYGMDINFGSRPPPESLAKGKPGASRSFGRKRKNRGRHGQGVSEKEGWAHSRNTKKKQELVAFAEEFRATLPAVTSSLDRSIGHQVAESFDLGHRSVAPGKARRSIRTKKEKAPALAKQQEAPQRPMSTRKAADVTVGVSPPAEARSESMLTQGLSGNRFAQLEESESDYVEDDEEAGSPTLDSSSVFGDTARGGANSSLVSFSGHQPNIDPQRGMKKGKRKHYKRGLKKSPDDMLEQYNLSDADLCNGLRKGSEKGIVSTNSVNGTTEPKLSSATSITRRDILAEDLKKKIRQAAKGRMKKF